MPASNPRDRLRQQWEKARQLLTDGHLFRARNLVDELLERHPDNVNILRLAAQVAEAEAKPDRALELLVEAAKREPTHVPTLDAIGRIAVGLDRLDVAQEALEHAAAANPTDPSRHRKLAEIYRLQGNLNDALGHLRIAVTLDASDLRSLELLASVLNQRDDPEGALATYERILELAPDHAVAMANASHVLEALGRQDEARAMLQRAAEVDPGNPAVAYYTKDLEVFEAGDPRIEVMVAVLDREASDVVPRTLAGLSAAKMLADAGDLPRAADCARRANELYTSLMERRRQAYAPQQEARLFSMLHATATEELVAGAPDDPIGPVPILLAGLPRSGKSLLEARLISHPAVADLGEAPLAVALQQVVEEVGGGRFPQVLTGLDGDQRRTIQRRFTEIAATRIGHDRPEIRAVTTTHPATFLLLQTIAAVDPRTVLVHCDRDVGDLLLACYLAWIPTGHAFTYTPEGLAHRYRLLQALYAHWSQLLGDRFVTSRYEELVTAPDQAVARVLATAGIDDPQLAGEVALAGAAPVAASPTARPDPSQPLHRAHVGLSEAWREHLPELFAAVEAPNLIDLTTPGGRLVWRADPAP